MEAAYQGTLDEKRHPEASGEWPEGREQESTRQILELERKGVMEADDRTVWELTKME